MVSEAQCLSSSISLNSLRLEVFLGCTEQERSVAQFVRIDVKLRFHTLPGGCFNDNLEETICFDRISDIIKDVCRKQEYRLVEKLGYDIYQGLRDQFSRSITLLVQVTKEKPPIPQLEGGASFTVGDFSES